MFNKGQMHLYDVILIKIRFGLVGERGGGGDIFIGGRIMAIIDLVSNNKKY